VLFVGIGQETRKWVIVFRHFKLDLPQFILALILILAGIVSIFLFSNYEAKLSGTNRDIVAIEAKYRIGQAKSGVDEGGILNEGESERSRTDR